MHLYIAMGCHPVRARHLLTHVFLPPIHLSASHATTASPAVALIATFTVATVVAFALFVVSSRVPSALKRWVSTIAILINHAQTISILGSLHLGWPMSVRMVISALRLNVFDFPQASCIFAEEGTDIDYGGIAVFHILCRHD